MCAIRKLGQDGEQESRTPRSEVWIRPHRRSASEKEQTARAERGKIRSERTESVCRMQSDETDARPCNSNRRAILNPEKS